jgi:hypothetical protein
MRKIRVFGLCLAAVFVFSAVAVASASAEGQPKFFKCVKEAASEKVGGKYTGTYTDSDCTVEASEATINEGKKNKYRAEALKEAGGGITFSYKSKATTITAHGVSGNLQTVACKMDKYEGELFDNYADGKVEATFTFEKCTGNHTEKCGNVGSETIQYKPSFSEAVWTEAGENRPGLLMVGPVTFSCGGEEVKIKGLVLGTLENTKKGLKVVFNVTGGGEQEDQTFWSEEEERTENHWFSSPGFEEATLEGSEEIKVKDVSVKKV